MHAPACAQGGIRATSKGGTGRKVIELVEKLGPKRGGKQREVSLEGDWICAVHKKARIKT
jgi:hypothetical protein